MEDNIKEYMHAVPCSRSIIIKADKAEEFLNMKPDEAIREKHRKMLKKYEHIVTDNTKK